MVTKRSNLLGSNTTRARERVASDRNRSRSPHRLGISSRYKRDQGYESDAVAVLKSGGSDGTSSRFLTLDLEVSSLGLEVPRDGRRQSGDASNMMEPMGPSPEPPTSLNLADIASKEDASPAIEREESPSSTPFFGKITQIKMARKCSNCHEMSHSKPRCPLLPCSYCSEMGHLARSCPLKAGRYYDGKTRASAVQIERRDLYHAKRSLDPAIKGKRREQARDLAEVRRLNPAAIEKSREQARDLAEVRRLNPAAIEKSREQASARHCGAMKTKTRRKHEEEKDGGDESVRQKKEAKRQYDLKRYANPAVREKARARHREAAKRKAGLNHNKGDGDYHPSARLESRIEAKRQYDANRQHDPAVMERRKETKGLRHEAVKLKARNLEDDEERYDDDNDSEAVKTRISKRASRAGLDEELDRLRELDLGLAEAIIGFHRRLTMVLKTSHDDHDKQQGFDDSGSSSLSELSST